MMVDCVNLFCRLRSQYLLQGLERFVIFWRCIAMAGAVLEPRILSVKLQVCSCLAASQVTVCSWAVMTVIPSHLRVLASELLWSRLAVLMVNFVTTDLKFF